MTAALNPLPLERTAPPLREDASGVIRIGQTRVTLESVVALFDQGASAEEIALRYDALHLEDIYATLGYVLAHREAVQAYLAHASHQSHKARLAAESPPSAAAIRRRLNRVRTSEADAPAG
jgi:uncharacterized protein (DUF433 family)